MASHLKNWAYRVVHHSLYGIKGTRELDELRESSYGLLSGLPFICSPVTESRFFNQIPTAHSEEFLLEMGKRQKQLGYLKGNIVNTDGHSIRSFSRMHMPKSYLSKEKIYNLPEDLRVEDWPMYSPISKIAPIHYGSS